MKTPREILLQRHRSAQPNLNAVRRQALAVVSERQPGLTPATFARQLWNELVLPCRGIWAGLAAVWLALLVLHLSGSSAARPVIMVKSRPANPEMFLAFREQQLILTELFGPASTPPPAAERPRNPSAPHSERSTGRKTA